jgi:hypothetical protein
LCGIIIIESTAKQLFGYDKQAVDKDGFIRQTCHADKRKQILCCDGRVSVLANKNI